MIAYLQVRNALRSTFADTKILGGVDALAIGVKAVKVALVATAIAAVAIGAVLAVGFAPFIYIGKQVADVFEGIYDLVSWAAGAISAIDWPATGRGVIDGLKAGLAAGAGGLYDAITNLGEGVKKKFKDVLGIHSPSKVFADYGKNTTEGYEQGVEQGSAGAQGAVSAMVGAPSGGKASGGAPVAVTVNIYASGGNAKEVAAAVSSQSVIEQITKAIVDAMHGGGVGVPG
jgi:hypothetical protein